MKLRDLMEVSPYIQIELASGRDGRIVAKSRDTLEKYGDVEVLSIHPKIRVNREGDWALPYLYVFGNARDIDKIKKGGDGNGKS